MKAKSKSELAAACGVCVDTFVQWLEPFKDELRAMGYENTMRVLPPHIT